MNTLETLLSWIDEESKPAGGLLVPLSGGSDSALIFWLLNQICPEKVVGIHVGDNLRCREWFESVGTVRLIPVPQCGEDDDLEVMRWAKVQSLCVKERRWLVGSRTYTEEALGTFSFASAVATFLPLANILKSDVMVLCEKVGVPTKILQSSRKADPDCGRPQEMAEISLEHIDVFLRHKLGLTSAETLEALSKGSIEYLERVYERNRYKHLLPKRGPKVTTSN